MRLASFLAWRSALRRSFSVKAEVSALICAGIDSTPLLTIVDVFGAGLVVLSCMLLFLVGATVVFACGLAVFAGAVAGFAFHGGFVYDVGEADFLTSSCCTCSVLGSEGIDGESVS